MTSGTRFLAAFNDIENSIRRSLNAEDYDDFASLARRYGDREHLITEQRRALSAFISLRNAISHGRYYDGRPIAEPVPQVVVDIEKLRDQIRTPPRAWTVLGQPTIAIVSPSDPITVALDYVRASDYSQFPVYDDGGYLGLLTTNAIARWLAHQMAANGGLAENENVADVIRFAEPYEQARLVKRDITVTNAIHRLTSGGPSGTPTIALILTAQGKRQDQPLAVAVASDLPRLYASVM